MSTLADGRHVHDALYHASDEELVGAAVPFLQEGIASGETAVLACDARTTELVQDAMDGDPRIAYLPWGDVYRRTPGAILAFQRLMQRELESGSPRVRLVTEVDFGHRRDRWTEWSRYEAALNHAMAPFPLWSVCLYDTSTLPEEVLRAGEANHPHVVTSVGRRPSPRYVPPEEFLRMTVSPTADPLQSGPPLFENRNLRDVLALRHDVRSVLASAGLPPETVAEFVLALSEVTTNALTHGRAPVSVDLWASSDRVVCTVTDRGPGVDDPFAGYLPHVVPDARQGGMGLWLARRLCDQLDLISSPKGFTVRLASGGWS